MDNVRNMTGSPIAGIDPHELLDVRPLNYGASVLAKEHSLALLRCKFSLSRTRAECLVIRYELLDLKERTALLQRSTT